MQNEMNEFGYDTQNDRLTDISNNGKVTLMKVPATNQKSVLLVIMVHAMGGSIK